MSHNSCNMGTRGLPDMYTLGPPLYILVKPLVHMLQLLNIASSPAFNIADRQGHSNKMHCESKDKVKLH